MKNIDWKKIGYWVLWIVLAVVLLLGIIWGVFVRQNKKVPVINITIDTDVNKQFVTKKDVHAMFKREGYDTLFNKPLSAIQLNILERALEANFWVQDAEVFVDRNGVVDIKIVQRCPLMRIIHKNDVGFYVDQNGRTMPYCPTFTPRVLIVSGEVTESIFNPRDTSQHFGQDLVHLAKLIQSSVFWQSQITMMDVKSPQMIHLFPLLGDAFIEFGGPENAEEKLNKLQTFYQSHLPQAYRKISLQFDRQVVATKK
jgi:cell division protein FtsQ